MLPSPATKAAAISDYLPGKGGYFQIALESEEPEFKTKDAEIRYLRDKVAYLETLTELMGYNPKEIPKK